MSAVAFLTAVALAKEVAKVEACGVGGKTGNENVRIVRRVPAALNRAEAAES